MPRRVPLARMGLALAVCAAAAGCQGESAPPPTTGWVAGTLRLGQRSDFRSLDPAIANDTALVPIVRMLFQPLLDYDDDVNLVPLVAEEVPELTLREPDGRAANLPAFAAGAVGLTAAPFGQGPLAAASALFPGRLTYTYTFRLKDGVAFSNGRAVTADDFVYSWERLLDPRTKSGGASYIVDKIVGAKYFAEGKTDHVDGLHALDARTLRVDLTKPDLTFLYVAAMTYLAPVPREEVENEKVPEEDRNDEFARRPVGNGPFVFKEWRRDLRMRLERDPHYWGPKPAGLQAIDVMFGLDDLTRQMMFERGELDLLDSIPAPAYVRLRKDPRWQPHFASVVFNGVYYLNLNCEMEPFSGPNGKKVRQAINYAIDKERLVQIANGRYIAAEGVVPPRMRDYHPRTRGYSYDPQRARELLAEAGYADGLPQTLTLWLANETSGGERMAEVIQQDLGAVGVKVTLNPVSYSSFLPEAGKRNTVAFSLSGWFQDYPDPSDFLDVLFSSASISDAESNNMAFYSNEEADRLMDAGDRETDPVKRLDLFARAEEVVVDDAPVVPLVVSKETWLHQPWVKGHKLHPVWLVRYEELSISPP